MPMSFDQPALLALLLVVVPAILLIHRASRAYLPGRRRAVVLAVRLALASLVVVAMAGPRLVRPLDRLSVVYLVDVSDSISATARADSLRFVQQSLRSIGPQDTAGIVVFGADALVELPSAHITGVGSFTSTPITTHTDLAAALRMGMALLSPNAGRRIVLLSDGNENLGSAMNEVKLAAAAGIQVSVVPLPGPTGPHILVTQVDTPPTIRKTDTFDLHLAIESNVVTTGTVRIFTDGRLTGEYPVKLKQGTNNFSFAQQPLNQGFHTFSAQLETSADPFVENKRGSSFTTVIGQPHVLLVEGKPGEGTDLARALQATGTLVDTRPPTGMPADLASLRAYDSVILVNVPASALPAPEMHTITAYVRDLGGGLVVVGGDKSFGAGGYSQTPIEDALPVSSTVKPRKDLPSTAIVFIIESLESNLGVDISKEAAKAALQTLTPLDQVGVINGNDGAGMWSVPLHQLTDKTAVEAKIDAMEPGDPPSYMPFLVAAGDALAGSQARTKHIILLGDGDASDNYQATVQGIAKRGITLSVVGTNVAPTDLAGLQSLAAWGHGRYYDGNDPFDIPQLLTRETQTVARPAIVEQASKPLVVSASPMLQGIDTASFPALRGYVATTAKPAAQVVLASSQGDPILADWQYGLGHTVVWTSDAKAQWASAWLHWPEFAQFWSQVVRDSLPAQVDQNVHVSVTSQDANAVVTVDSMTPDHQFRNFLTTRATIFSPSQQRSDLLLHQSAPGRYVGRFPVPQDGTYLLQISQTDPKGNVVASQTSGYVVPYSPEYRDLSPNSRLLGQLASATGGMVLTTPQQVFLHNLPQAQSSLALWPLLLLLAILGFLVDVGLRRLRLTPSDIREWLARLFDRGRSVFPETETARRFRGVRERLTLLREETAGTAASVATLTHVRAPAPTTSTSAPSTFAQVAANMERRPTARAASTASAPVHAPVPEPSTLAAPPTVPAKAVAGAGSQPRSRPQPVVSAKSEAPSPRADAPGHAGRPLAGQDSDEAPTSRLLAAKERARRRTGG